MNSYTKTEVDYLLHLIYCTIHNEKPKKFENVNYSALFELAKMQQIYNLINDKIQSQDHISLSDKALFRDYCLSEFKRMIAIGTERSIIFSLLKENKVKFMPLKGLIFKNYYPKESMRQMSDNDILFDETKRDTVAKIMRELSYETCNEDENSDDYIKKPYYTFEFHRSLFYDDCDFCPVFDNVWKNAVQDEDNDYMFHMGLDDTYIYSICHMYKHFIKSCCGVRFIVDNYLFLEKEYNNLNWDYIHCELKKYNLCEYEKQTRELAKKLFDGEELSPDEHKLLEKYTNFGIYGSKEGGILQRYSAAAEKNSKKSAAVKYYLRRLFPAKRDMIYNYPILEKAPWLLPLMYVYRFFKGLFHTKKAIKEIKIVKKIQKEN